MTLELIAKVTVILVAVTCGSLLLRRSSAAARHLSLVAGLAGALVLPLAAIALPAWDLPVLSTSTAETRPPDPVPGPVGAVAPQHGPPSVPEPRGSRGRTGQEDDCSCDDRPLVDVGARERDETLLAVAPTMPGQSDHGRRSSAATTPYPWLYWIWALGAAAVLARLGRSWLRMTRLAIESTPLACRRTWRLIHDCRGRLGLRLEPRVLTSETVRVPMLWGFLRPTLLLPSAATSWPEGRLRVVLLHELAHLRRLDGLSLLLGRLSAATWWFHPVVWFLERRARRDCETACDDIVLACGERPSIYAEHLLQIAGELPAASTPAPGGVLAVVNPGQLSHRVRSILEPRAPRGLGWPSAAALTTLVVVGLLSVSSARLVERPRDLSTTKDERIARAGMERVAAHVLAQHVSGDVDHDERHGGDILLAHEGDHEGERAFEQAYEAHRAEEFERAIEGFLEAAEAGYRTDTSLYNAACGHARMGNAAAATDLIERSIEAGFDSYELLFEDSDLDPIRRDPAFRGLMEQLRQEGRIHSRAGDRFELAEERYDDLVSAGSTEGKEWYEVGSVLLRLRDFERGVDALDRAVELLGHQNQNALYNLACAYSLRGDTGQALDYLERAVLAGFDSEERFRNDSDLDNIRDERRFDQIEELHDTLSLDRFRRHVNWGGRGSEYSARRWEPAVEEFTALTRQNPTMGRAWFNLGWSLHFSRRHAEAREAFHKQLDLDYRPSNATYNIACTYAMEGNPDEAMSWLGRAVDTGHVSFHQMLGDDDLESLHDDPRFEELLERAAEKDDLRERLHHREKIRRWKESRAEREGATLY